MTVPPTWSAPPEPDVPTPVVDPAPYPPADPWSTPPPPPQWTPSGPPPDAPPRPRRHRILFWTAILAVLAVIAGGGYLAATAYQDNAAPERVVTDYFAALTAGDAAAALSYGAIPAGTQDLLTSRILQAQQDIAPISDLVVKSVQSNGDSATAAVSYRLGFASDPVTVDDSIALVRDGRTWRFAAVAIATNIFLSKAAGRATLAGGALPTGSRLLFPGAVPIAFDTANLALSEDTRQITFASGGSVQQDAAPTEAAATAIGEAIDAEFAACIDGSAPTEALCPLPADTRAVPGTLRGTVTSPLSDDLDITVQGNAEGILRLVGNATVDGQYKQLDFNNREVDKTGDVNIRVIGSCYASDCSTITWLTQ